MNLWLARDYNGELYGYQSKPIRYGSLFAPADEEFVVNLPTEMYPEVTFENSPIELKTTI